MGLRCKCRDDILFHARTLDLEASLSTDRGAFATALTGLCLPTLTKQQAVWEGVSLCHVPAPARSGSYRRTCRPAEGSGQGDVLLLVGPVGGGEHYRLVIGVLDLD
jgi:hypothetical protein